MPKNKIQSLTYRLCASLLLVNVPALASSSTSFYFGVNGGYSQSSFYDSIESYFGYQGDIEDPAYQYSTKDDSPSLGVSAGVSLNPYLTFDGKLSIGERYRFRQTYYLQETIDGPYVLDSRADETLKVNYAGLSALAGFPLFSRLSVYGRAGLNLWHIQNDYIDTYESASPEIPNPDYSNNKDFTGWGYVGGLGLSFFLDQKYRFEVRSEWQYNLFNNFDGMYHDLKNTNQVFSASVIYHFRRKAQTHRIDPTVLPRLTMADSHTEVGTPLDFVLRMEPVPDKPLAISVSTEVEQALVRSGIIGDHLKVSFDNGHSWQDAELNQTQRIVIPARTSTATMRINTRAKSTVEKPGQVSLQVDSDELDTNQLQARGTIYNNKTHDPSSTTIQASVTNTNLALAEKGIAPEVAVVTTPVKPQQMPFEKVLPVVSSLSEHQPSNDEVLVDSLLNQDLNVSRASREDASPLLALPPSFLHVSSNTAAKQKDLSYESVEAMAIKSKTGIVVWGNTLSADDSVLLTPHLSLVNEPASFEISFPELNKLSLNVAIPRTRFSFALKEFKSEELSQGRYLLLADVETFTSKHAKTSNKERLTAGTMLSVKQANRPWFQLSRENQPDIWIRTDNLAAVPDQVYIKPKVLPTKLALQDTELKAVEVENADQAYAVITVAKKDNQDWFLIDMDGQQRWADGRLLEAKPLLPVTEFVNALQYFQQGELSQAKQSIIRFLNSADKEKENNVVLSTAYQILALSHMQLGEWKAASNVLDKAILLTRYDPGVYNFKMLAILGEHMSSNRELPLKSIVDNLSHVLYLEPADEMAKQIVIALKKYLGGEKAAKKVAATTTDRSDELKTLFQNYSFAGLD